MPLPVVFICYLSSAISVLGCNQSPSPLSGLFIDLSANSEGNGSECFPFSTVDSVLMLAVAESVAVIRFVEGSAEGEIASPVIVGGSLTIEGAGTRIWSKESVTVGEMGYLELRNLTFTQSDGDTNTVIFAFGEVQIIDCQFEEMKTFVSEIETGKITIQRSRFFDCSYTLFRMHRLAANMDIQDCVLKKVSGDAISYHTEEIEQFDGCMNVERTVVTELSGKFVNILKELSKQLMITMKDSTISSIGESVYGGILTNFSVSVRNSTFSNLNQVIFGSPIKSALSFTDCDFLSINLAVFQFVSMKGQLSIFNTKIDGVAQGPVVLIPGNTYNLKDAIIHMENATITNVINLNVLFTGGVFSCYSVSVYTKNLTVYHIQTYRSGLFLLTASIGVFDLIDYSNSSSRISSLMDLVYSTLIVRDMNVRWVEHNSGVLSNMMSTSGMWDRVSIIDLIDRLRLNANRPNVILWCGFGQPFTVQNSYFRNPGYSVVHMAATSRATLTMINITNVDNNNTRTFDILDNALIMAQNLTFVRPFISAIFTCMQEKACYAITDIRFKDIIKLSTIMSIVSGEGYVYNTTFDSLPTTYFRLFNGRLRVSNVTISNSYSTLIGGCINALAYVDGLTLRNLRTYMLIQMSFSTFTVANSVFDSISATEIVALELSTFTFNRTTIINSSMDSFGGLISAESQSTVNIIESSFSGIIGILSMKMGLISVSQSSLYLSRSAFSSFTSTLIDSIQSDVIISDSYFSNGGLGQTSNKAVKMLGGVLLSENSKNVAIIRNVFDSVTADFGGVVYFSNSNDTVVLYENNEARDCSVTNDGGVIYGKTGRLTIKDSTFMRNSASNGGALAVIRPTFANSFDVIHSEWINNTAIFNGGAIYHLNCELNINNSVMKGNYASYGNDIASHITYISVIDSDSYYPLRNFSISAASGQGMKQIILLGNFDMHDQLRVTDNSTRIALYSPIETVEVLGSVLLTAQKGTYTVNNLIVIGAPETTVEIWGQVGNVSNFMFTVNLRECIVGEYFDNLECIPCTHNTYSFSPSIPCKLCPREASCTEGFKLTLSAGYWRASTITDSIYPCIVDRMCLGGFSSACLDGHTGIMCAECQNDHYKLNQLQCIDCYDLGISVLKALFSLTISLWTTAIAISKGTNAIMVHMVVMDFFRSIRIFVNFNIYWPDSLAYLYTVMGDIGSVTLTSFCDSCLGKVSNTSAVTSHILISLIYFIVLPFSIWFLAWFIPRFRIHISRRALNRGAFYLCYSMIPMLFLRAVQLFPCFSIDGTLRLISEPSMTCWEGEHRRITIGLGIPILIFTLLSPSALLLLSRKFKSWNLVAMTVFLIRLVTMTCILLFSASLTLSSQVGISIILNITTEIVMYQITSFQKMFFASLYQSTLISSVLLSFVCAIYSASNASTSHKEAAFIFANYFCVSLPLLYTGAVYVQNRRKWKMYVQPDVNVRGSSGSELREVDESVRSSSQIALNVPHSTPIQSPKEVE